MAISIDAVTASPYDAGSTGLTQAHTTAVGAKKIVVALGVRGDPTTASMTYAGQALTLIDFFGAPLDFEYTALFYRDNPASGTNNVVVSLGASLANFVVIYTLNAAAAIVTDGSPAHDGPGTGTTISVSITDGTGGAGTIGICAVTSEDNASPQLTAEADLTANLVTNGNWGGGGAYELAPSGTELFSFTKLGGGDTAAIVAQLFREASGLTKTGAGVIGP